MQTIFTRARTAGVLAPGRERQISTQVNGLRPDVHAVVMRTALGLLVVAAGVAAVVVLMARVMRSTAADIRQEVSDPAAVRRRQLTMAAVALVATISCVRVAGSWWGLLAPAIGLAIGGVVWLRDRNQRG